MHGGSIWVAPMQARRAQYAFVTAGIAKIESGLYETAHDEELKWLPVTDVHARVNDSKFVQLYRWTRVGF